MEILIEIVEAVKLGQRVIMGVFNYSVVDWQMPHWDKGGK